ncbi:hypothetical protein ACVXG9_06675 [Escherichia coli]
MSLKSQGITRKRTAKFVSLYGVVKFSSTVRFRLWHCAMVRRRYECWRVIPSPLRTPGVRLTIRLSDNPAATPSVINFLVTFGGISFLHNCSAALFKVNFVMR